MNTQSLLESQAATIRNMAIDTYSATLPAGAVGWIEITGSTVRELGRFPGYREAYLARRGTSKGTIVRSARRGS